MAIALDYLADYCDGRGLTTIRVYLYMPVAKKVIVKKRLLEWLMNITLVLAFISFSGHGYSFKTHINKATRQELKITNRVSAKKTISYKTLVRELGGSSSQEPRLTKQFILALLQYDIITKLKYRTSLKALVFLKKPDPLPVVYFTDQPAGFEFIMLRG